MLAGQVAHAEAVSPAPAVPQSSRAEQMRLLRYREIQHKAADFAGDGPDALERRKGKRLEAVVRSAQLMRHYGDSFELSRGRLQHHSVRGSWQVTPSLWLGLSVAKSALDMQQQTDALIGDSSDGRSLESIAPSAAFKIMDTLILAYRPMAMHDQIKSLLVGTDTVNRSWAQEIALRLKGQVFEIAYRQRRSLEGQRFQPSWAWDARYHFLRTLSGLLHYERQTLQWYDLQLDAARESLITLGLMGQIGAWTIAGEWREAGFESAALRRFAGLAMALDYDFLAAQSLGLMCEHWQSRVQPKATPELRLTGCGLRLSMGL